MQTIYKYRLQLTEKQTLRLPEGFTILDVQLQAGQFQMWAIIDTSKDEESRNIWIAGTGHPVPIAPAEYLATVQVDRYVWHFFLEGK